LSVTLIEDWISNPYSIFAKKILDLEPLPELGAVPDAALRGQIIHRALHQFSELYPQQLPENIAESLVLIATEVLDEYKAHPRVGAFWEPRFERFANWFAETEPERRREILRISTETAGTLTFTTSGGEFKLTARADRIDVDAQSTVTIYDYKTGVLPKDKDVSSGKKPQLTLEGAIALAGGFTDVGTAGLKGLRYILASGGEPPGRDFAIKAQSLEQLSADALRNLKNLVALFDLETTAYKALRRPNFDYRYDSYSHLARVKEWSSTEEHG
jgi:ATP-dependent helicase/nuclease subunit B